MTLLGRVVAALNERGVPFVVIGASALAARGVSRSTHDVDLLTTDRRVLDLSTWPQLPDIVVDVRRGETDDPLAGVVRFSVAHEPDVDLIVGRAAWQAAIINRADRIVLGDVDLPVARAADLVLLKLFAGGSQDRWDIDQLLAAETGAAVGAEVEQRLPDLPASARAVWETLRRR